MQASLGAGSSLMGQQFRRASLKDIGVEVGLARHFCMNSMVP
jgi:hypothetical protein